MPKNVILLRKNRDIQNHTEFALFDFKLQLPCKMSARLETQSFTFCFIKKIYPLIKMHSELHYMQFTTASRHVNTKKKLKRE